MTGSRRSSGLAAVAAATAAVFVAGRRAGSAVLVDEWRLLTAGHVLRRGAASAGVPPAVIEVEFPFTSAGGAGARVPARQAVLDAAAASMDVAMLDLAPDWEPPGWLPAAVPLWPARRLPERVSVFGFPQAEKALRGVWRDFHTSGPVADGTVQLDWAADAGTLRGHSGGPVADPHTGALVGLLTHGSQAGRFDRFVPVTVIGERCPGLPFPWLMAGTDARSHFTRRSRGQRGLARGGDLFRGRAAALTAVGGWLTDPDHQGRPLVVTGQPGAGKSAVLARAVLNLEAARTGPGLAFHARGATHDDLLAAVADLTGVEHSATRDELLQALADQPGAERVMIAVDALDEAASGPDRREITATLTELAAVPRARVAVATRPLSAGNRYYPGGLLPALGISSADSAALVDLDTDRYFDPEGLRQFAGAVLTQHQAAHPGPAGAAWITYRADSALCDRLAGVIAARADRNYLVAALAAVQLSGADQPADPAASGFDPARIPTGVNEALARYLEQLPGPQQSRTRALLTALAYARGGGVDDRVWAAFTGALGYPVSTPDLDELRGGTAADYLLQAVPDDRGPVTQLFHQALADELLAPRHQLSDERALLAVLRPAPGASWATASGYALAYASDHACGARQLLGLLDDPDYLMHADLARLPALLSRDPGTAADPVAVIVRQAAVRASPLPPPRRARLLALTAAHFGLQDLRRRFAAARTQPFTPLWAHSLGNPHMEITGHDGAVTAVAIGRIGDRDVIISGSSDMFKDDGDNTVRVWDAATGQPRGRPLTGHTSAVSGVTFGRAGDCDVAISASWDRTVRVWDAVTGQLRGEPLTGHTGVVHAVAIGRIGDRDVVISASADGTVRMWDAATGQPRGEPLTGHTGAVFGVAIGRIGDRDAIVAVGLGETIRVWDAVTGQARGELLTGHASEGAVWVGGAVAIGRAGDRDVIVSVGQSETIRVWDAVTGQPRGEPLSGHTGVVAAVAIGRIGDRDIIVSGGADGTVRVWDAVTGQLRGEPLTGHTGVVAAVAIGRIGDRDVIVSGGADGTVRVWDTTPARIPGEPLSGHTNFVYAVMVRRTGGSDVIVSASADGTVRTWDAGTGQPRAAPTTVHTEMSSPMAIGRIGGSDVIVFGGGDHETYDNAVWVCDAATGQLRGEPLTGHTEWSQAVAIGRIGRRDVIISGGADCTVRVWDAATGRPRGKPLTSPDGAVTAVAIGRIGKRDAIIAGSTSDGAIHTVRVWDAATGQPRGGPLTGHTGEVAAVAIGRIGDRDVIVSASHDKTILVWDAVTGQPRGEPLTGHTGVVHAVAIGRIGDRDVIVSGSTDETVRIWDTSAGGSLVIDLLGQPAAAALTTDGRSLCVAAGHRICLFNV